MSVRNTAILAAAAAVALPLAAGAQGVGAFLPAPVPGAVTALYIAGGFGANWKEMQELRAGGFSVAPGAPQPLASPNGRANYLTGFVGLGSVGWGFGNGLRVELEGSWRENEAETVKGFGRQTGFDRAGGFQRTYAVMGNALFDFRIPAVPFVTPYFGAGAGYAWSDFRNLRFNSRGAPPGSFNVNGDQGEFAYQAIGGVAFNVAQVPGLALTLEYRYFATLRTDFTATNRNFATGAASTARFSADNQNHSALLGVRYAFNQPRPAVAAAPAPAPAAAPARTYLVFFDWDRADLTDRARQIIAEAATNARTVRSTRIEVAGHADRSGPDAYNMRLSQRRGDAVAAELVRRGINRNEIVVQAFGETRPLVPTADGVREPQNRRVEIVLR